MKILKLVPGLFFFMSLICSAQKSDDHIDKTIQKPGFYTITGKITDRSTANPLSYINVYISGIATGAVSDINGIYKIFHIKPGTYEIKYSFIGYKDETRYIQLTSHTELNISMDQSFIELENVTITPGNYNIAATEPTLNKLSSKEILLSPNFAKDISRTLFMSLAQHRLLT